MTVLELRKALEPFSPEAQVVLGGVRLFEVQEVQKASCEDEDSAYKDETPVREGDAILVFWSEP